jgi:hypothetical protein
MRNNLYRIFKDLNTELINAGFRNVTIGADVEVDMNKQTIYPLAHIVLPTALQAEVMTRISFQIIGADIVDFTQDDEITDQVNDFIGEDNVQDILQDILARFQEAFKKLTNSATYPGYDILYDIQYESFKNQYTNLLAGWKATVEIEVPNMDDGNCIAVAGEVPTIPTGLRVVVLSHTSATVFWDVGTNLTGYRYDNFDQAQLDPECTTDIGLVQEITLLELKETTYMFYILAYNSFGDSEIAYTSISLPEH